MNNLADIEKMKNKPIIELVLLAIVAIVTTSILIRLGWVEAFIWVNYRFFELFLIVISCFVGIIAGLYALFFIIRELATIIILKDTF